MEFIECAEYRKACEKASGANLPWEKLKGASVMISGATGNDWQLSDRSHHVSESESKSWMQSDCTGKK